MDLDGAVALVTGANRGLGEAFTRGLLARGAKVYGAARDPSTIRVEGVEPLRLDVTSADDLAAARRRCGDLTLLVNNAGISTGTRVLSEGAIEAGRRELETNVFGMLATSQAFAPVLAANGGGAIVNVLSVLSWLSLPATAMYAASKAAAWSVTNSLRLELRPQGTLVVGVHCGFLDTDMAARVDQPKLAPREVVEQALDAVVAGRTEVLADEVSRRVRAGLSGVLVALYPELG